MAQLAAMPQSNGLANIAQLIQQLAPVFFGTGAQQQSGTQTTGGTTTNTQQTGTAPDILAQIQQLLGQVQGTGQQFSREQAIADSSGAINTQILDAIRANMPSVLAGGKGAGLYGDTTTQLLQNDLMARIAGEAAKAQTNTIAQYGQLANQNQGTAANLLNALAQTNRTQTQTQTDNQTRTSNQTTQTQPVVPTGVSAGGLGALGALSLAKNAKDLFGGAKDLLGLGSTGGGSALPAFDFGLTVPDVSSFFSGGASDLLSGGSALGGAFDPFGSSFGNLSDFGASGIGDVSSTLGSFAGVEPGLAGVFTGGGSDALNLGTGVGQGLDFFGGLADAGKGFLDIFGDIGSGIGDFFGGFFADGGMIHKGKMLSPRNVKGYADGGYVSNNKPDLTKDIAASIISAFELNHLPPFYQQVRGYADGGQVTRGRQGGFSYNEEGAAAKATRGMGNIQRARALWEELTRGGTEQPRFDEPTVIAGNEGALGGAQAPAIINRPSISQNLPSLERLQAIEQALSPVRTRIEEQRAASEPSDLKQVGQDVSQIRQGNKIAEALLPAPVSIGDIAAASQLGGAGNVLASSPISGSASVGAGAGAGSAAAGSLGTVDTLGSILGTGSYLPTYGAASSAAGTGAASPLFGSAAGAGEAGTAAASGASGALSATGVGAVAALLVNSFLPIIFGGFSGSREGNEAIMAALNPQETFGKSSNALGEGGLSRNFFRKYYGDLVTADSGNPNFLYATTPNAQAINEAYQRAAADIKSGNLGVDIPPSELAKVQAGLTASNEQIANNPALLQEAYQPHYAPGNPVFQAYQEQLAAGTLPQGTIAPTVSQEYEIRPDTGMMFGGDLAYLDAQRQAGNAGATFLADGGPVEGQIGSRKNDPKGNKDNVPIMASEGEFVIPTPVVDALGPDFFNKLIAAFNVPSAVR